MKKGFWLAPLALVALPFASVSASAVEVSIRTAPERSMHRTVVRHDRGLHRGHGSVRRTVVRREVGMAGSTRVTKKITRTNAHGDRITKKVTRTVD